MSDRMTDERLAELGALLIPRDWPPYRVPPVDELHRALVAERGRVVRLEAALTDILNVQGFPASTRLPPALMDAVGHAKAVLAEGATT